MTHHDINSMPAGKEMDQLIYDKIFRESFFGEHPTHLIPDDFDFVNLPNYSTDISAAWEVVERLAEHDAMEIYLLRQADGCRICKKWCCYSFFEESLADTAPLAICRCALKYVTPD